jgi:hypothetical protein
VLPEAGDKEFSPEIVIIWPGFHLCVADEGNECDLKIKNI